MYTPQINNFQDNSLENSNQRLQSHENEHPIKSYTDQIISSLKTCNIIKVHESQINGINISNDGNLILTSSKDDSITIYSIQRNEISSHYINKTHGCEKAIFTHHTNAILCASKNDYRIMYWLLHNNEILFSFQGHSDVITELNLNPNNDLFISTSLDKTSRLWNLNLKECVCIFQESNCANFDNSGNIIVSVTSVHNKNNEIYENFINLYNVNDILKGPFDVFSIKGKSEIKQIKYTYNNNFIIAICESNFFIIESSKGKIISNKENEDNLIRFDISPDDKYIAISCESGNILIYDIKGNLIKTLEFHTMGCECLEFNKKYAMLATADNDLVIWIPTVTE